MFLLLEIIWSLKNKFNHMLKVELNKHSSILNFIFEVPLPKSAYSHEGFIPFNNMLKRNGIETQYNRNQELTDMTCSFNQWINLIEDNLISEEVTFQYKVFEELVRNESKEIGDGLEVNFHQKSFDTAQRYWDFILNQGNFATYFFNRVNWYLAPRNAIVTPFPLHVDLESANTCNMACPMCYRVEMKEIGQMEMDLFKKIVDECEMYSVYSVRLSWRGETLSHPNIKEMIAYATKKIKNVSFLTNAFYLDEDMIDCFIENGVSYVAVSFDGIGETYESIRHPAKFDESYRKLSRLRDKKNELNSKLPQVRLCTIWPAISHDPDAYYITMKKVSDYIVCNPYINFKGPMTVKEDFVCQYPWERIVVAFNGKTQCCTGWNATDIILGNAKDQSIYDMWHSELMNNIRSTHQKGQRMSLASCADCRHGSKGEENISVTEIIDRNY